MPRLTETAQQVDNAIELVELPCSPILFAVMTQRIVSLYAEEIEEAKDRLDFTNSAEDLMRRIIKLVHRHLGDT